MSRQNYQSRLDELRTDVLYMNELVSDQLRTALDALERGDAERGEQVITDDAEINEMYLELENTCTNLIALQQPVAGDLRFIAATFKIITDLERIADLATNLGRYAGEAERERFPDVDIQRIGDETLAMLEQATQAYANESPASCYEVSERDNQVDALCEAANESVVRDLINREALDNESLHTIMRDVSRLLLTIRDLERVGDHSVNIAARTVYMVENDDELLY